MEYQYTSRHEELYAFGSETDIFLMEHEQNGLISENKESERGEVMLPKFSKDRILTFCRKRILV